MEPLAERMRPRSLDEYVGQQHLVGEGCVLRRMVESGNVSSLILWGPPGVGKTTLAKIISSQLERVFFTLSAINSGVKDVREVLDKAKNSKFFNAKSPILFIDEIHRFNKAQQDSLLSAVEEGVVTLIGATTENPSFEVISPLLSRCQVYVLKSLEDADLLKLLDRAVREDVELSKMEIRVDDTSALLHFSGGDARRMLNILELVVNSQEGNEEKVVDNERVTSVLQHTSMHYDKKGEMHYDIISAFIKSIRGSDPDAAVYWLACMIESGEDPKFIARRLIISASEDIGLANPNALLMANQAFDAVNKIGFPEARIILAEATVYLARSKKDNSAYLAIDEALAEVRQNGNLPVPLHLRNAETKLLRQLGYGVDYKYPHDYPGHYIEQQYLPDKLVGRKFVK